MILESANKEGGSTKTKIMYKAFLSFAQLKEYLLILSQNDLLQYEEITQVYKTTTKGKGVSGSYSSNCKAKLTLITSK